MALLLVRLALADRDDQALFGLLHVGDVQADEFAAAHGTRKTNEQQRPVARADDLALGQMVHHDPDVGGQGGGLALGSDPLVAPNAAPNGAYERVLDRRLGKAGGGVGLGCLLYTSPSPRDS